MSLIVSAQADYKETEIPVAKLTLARQIGPPRRVIIIHSSCSASVLIPKSISFYAFAARVRRQKRWMLAKMSLAVFVQRNGLGSALVAST